MKMRNFRNMLRCIILFITTIMIPLSVHASASAVVVKSHDYDYQISDHIAIFEDVHNKYKIEDIRKIENPNLFKPNSIRRPSYGYTNSSFWAHF
ncbi:MAG TPA: 7TM-DISM domain-containing protein, partial [Spirochaetota bacterium]|nr:7TM-DISM domain-containing protein [Spirochaetota bacterium]